MRSTSVVSILLTAIGACLILSCNNPKKASPEAIVRFNNIIPKPVSATLEGNSYSITDKTVIRYEGDQEINQIANFLANKIKKSTGFELAVKSASSNEEKNSIFLTLAGADANLGDEGYELTINDSGIKLIANKPSGLFMGVQTLRLLLPESIELDSIQNTNWEIATGAIRDWPIYAWRGSMLDVARHFLSVAEVKQYIDLISLYKMNMLHLSLTNDQGWRIEIKSWPNLALIGGQTQVGGGAGGFYTQEQYADIVNYAKDRYVTIVPEVDMPGHTNAALASYGELNGGIIVPKEGSIESPTQGDLGKDKPTKLYSGTEVGFSTLTFRKPATVKFIEDVIRELAAITPGPYIHIGGDEAHVTPKPEYIEFVNKFQEIVEKNGKIMIGWEEIAQGNINTKSIAQFWTNPKYATLAASKGAKVLLSPSTNIYLDMMYDTKSRIGYHWAAYIEVDSAYRWKPETKVPNVSRDMIVGVEAPLWGETIKNFNDVEYLAFPRIPGVAEIGWTPSEARDWKEYRQRLANQAKRFKALHVDYYRSPLVNWID